MDFATLNGQRVISASVTIPIQGTWSADVVLSSDTTTPTSVTLAIADITLVGTAFRTAAFSGSRSLRLVGGAAGWRKTLPAKGYSSPAGVRLKSVLDDAARESGETMAPYADATIGSFFTRDRQPAERVLRSLAPSWWMGLDGETHIEARPSGAITSPFTVTSWSGGKGQFEIATEKLSDWMPGRSFTSPTVTTAQTISTTQIQVDNAGKLRLTVLNTRGTGDRLLDHVRSIIRDELASLVFSGVWEYELALTEGDTVDLVSTDSRVPNLTKIPLRSSVMGEKVTPAPGGKCLVAFVNSDPSRPVVLSIDGAPLVAEIGATVTKIGNGAVPLAAAGDFAGPFPIVAAITTGRILG